MQMVFYFILILIINAAVFFLLSRSIRFAENKRRIISTMTLFLLMSFATGRFFEKRYTIPVKLASNISGQSIEDLDWFKEGEVQRFALNQYDSIKDERVKIILRQLSNECNKNDSVSSYLHLAHVKFNNLKIWTHKTEHGNKIFLVSREHLLK